CIWCTVVSLFRTFPVRASTENVLTIDNCDGRRSSHHPYLNNRHLSEEPSDGYAGCASRYGDACEARYSATDMSPAVGPVGNDRLSCSCLMT
ncbi:unnamed protein product, partial [Ectocarpus sp. 6 AP-2014]